MDTNKFRFIALPATLALALLALAPAAQAQDTTADNDAEVQTSVPADRIADRYADTLFDGDETAAADTIENLRKGGDIETTNADGTTTTIGNANGPMGYGEINIALGMAEKMIDGGDAETWQDALYGSADTTNSDGTVVEGGDGILQMRADGMGWGQIAKELGFKLGSVVGKAPVREASDDDSDTSTTTAKADTHGNKPDHATKADHPAKPERVAKVDRPERVERPSKPERPERPQKPERSGRP